MEIMENHKEQVEIMEIKCYKRIKLTNGMGYKFEVES